MSDDLLARHIEQERAIESAWRWFRRSKNAVVPLSAIVARVKARCPDADALAIRNGRG
jgi:hypothetical protein